MTALKSKDSPAPEISQAQLDKLGKLFTERQYPELEKHCYDLLEIEPSRFSIYQLLGLAQSGQKKFKEAIESYRKFLEQRPDFPDALINLGIALDKTGDSEEARDVLLKAVAVAPDNVAIHDLLGDIYTRFGDQEKAAKSLAEAVRLMPNNPVFLDRFGATLNNLGEFQKAENILRKAIQLDENQAAAQRNLGSVLRNIGRLDEALECFNKAAFLAPDDAEVFNCLASVYFLQGKYDDAIKSHEKTLAFYPLNEVVHANLGAAYYKKGEWLKALNSFQISLKLCPDQNWVLVNLSETLAVMNNFEDLGEDIIDIILQCFRNPEIESLSVSKAAMGVLKQLPCFCTNEKTQLHDVISIGEKHFELLVQLISETVIPDMVFENTLRMLREQLLDKYLASGILENRELDLAEALSYQGHKNEYVWWQSSLETEAVAQLLVRLRESVANGKEIDRDLLFVTGCYTPYFSDEVISGWAGKLFGPGNKSRIGTYQRRMKESRLGNYLYRMVVAPREYIEASEDIPVLTQIEDTVSMAVQGQYEENPYPSWDSLSAGQSKLYSEKIRYEILPNSPNLVAATMQPSILIAGCGTGKHALMTSLYNRNSNILALDLSRASLGYAKRSAEKYGIKNVRFGQGDLLKVEEIGEDFDVIESVGVLHHMSDPEEGLKCLLKCLKPGGYLKLGLYSESARQAVKYLRENTDIDDVVLTAQGIREYRQFLRRNMPKLYQRFSFSKDFCTVSSLRDLILHVQEHRYTIPLLKRMLQENGLKFLGFVLRDSRVKVDYQGMFPDDPSCTNLDNWAVYEDRNPRTFAAMYQFWCMKMQ